MTWPTGRQYSIATSLLLMAIGLSWLAYQGSPWQQLIGGGITVGCALLAWKRPSWLAYLSIAELVVGGKGYLFYLTVSGGKISIRLILFVLLFTRALPFVIRQWRDLRAKILSTSFLLFMAWIIVASLIALVRGVALGSIFYDVNAFIYLSLLPAWWIFIRLDPQWRPRLVALLLAGATVIGVESWFFVLLFAHPVPTIHQIYTWIRNTGLGEITYINNNIYRVFLQSQIYSVLVLIFGLTLWLRQRPPRWWLLPLAFSALGIYISLSRSFWLGLVVALFVGAIWLLRHRQWRAMLHLWILAPLALFAWAMMIWAISWPQFSLHGSATALSSRLQGTNSADAATARKNQIQPLLKAIGHHPILGSGFGQTVTYFSTDPTVHGWRTTAAFELGYLDLWLKIGLVGVALYAAWIVSVWKKLRSSALAFPLIIASVAVVTIHLTTPYLNHPLGLGWLMLVSLFAYDPA